MAIKVSIQNVIALIGGQGALLVTGVLIPSGNYPAGGDTVDFTAAVADPALVGGAGPFIDSALPVENYDAWSQGGNIANTYFPIVGSTQKNCKLKIASSFGGELVAGAYPAAVLADNIGFSAVFSKAA